MKIIVRMPNWVGDLVMATPLLTDLRRHFPDAHITAMCRRGLSELLKGDRDIDEVFAFTSPSGWLKKDERRDLIRSLRRGQYELGILLTNSFSSAWWFWRGRVHRRIGFRNEGRGFLLTDKVSFPKEREKQHLVVTYKELLRPLNIPPSDTKPRLHLMEGERSAARDILRQQGVPDGATVVGINPGAAYGSSKCWLPERFCEVAKALIEGPSVYVVFFGDANGSALVKEICQKLPDRVINLAGGTTLRELVALIQLCDLFLTNDSGPMHIASALGTPLIALFGSTSSTKTGPYNGGMVIEKGVECSPCYLRECPIDHKCMKEITTQEVVDQMRQMLAHRREPGSA